MAEHVFRSTVAAIKRGDLPLRKYYSSRDCICPRCSDHCTTVTGSEFCSDCEIRHATGGAVCH